jgi:hypothetical protein
MEKGIVLVHNEYEEPMRLEICGHLDKDNGKNVGVEYELRVEDEEANAEASLWFDKSGNFLRQDESSSPRIAAVFAACRKGERSYDTLTGRAWIALDECIARMGENLNNIIVQYTNECCGIQRAKAFRAEDYEPEEDDSGDFVTETFGSVDEAKKDLEGRLKSNSDWKRKTARLALERLEWL